jgi:hypothetical protein
MVMVMVMMMMIIIIIIIFGRDRRIFPKFTGTSIIYPPLKDKIAMKKMA